MKRYFFNSTFFLMLLIFQGCFSQNRVISSTQDIKQANLDYNKIYNKLLTQYKSWKGVQYKYGGYSKKGIDCSAFVQRTFKESLDFKLPRTTKLQLKTGEKIAITNLLAGDLIFFSTGYKTNHVGIYLRNGKFMHVSTSKGVIISRIDNPYFSKNIKEIRRVLY